MAKESGEHRKKNKLSSVVQPKEGNDELTQLNNQSEKELVHTREDMQSLTKALKTSKEELQSITVEINSLNQLLREKQEQLKAVWDNLEAILSTIKEPLLILDKNLRIKFANQFFYTKFNIAEQEVKDNLLYQIQNSRWNNKKLLEILQHSLSQKNSKQDFEMILDERIILLNAQKIWSPKNMEPLILLAIKDVNDSRMDKKLKTSEEKLTEFFMQAPAIFAILKEPEHVFEFANVAYMNLIGDRNPIGKQIREVLPELEEQGFIALLDKVYSPGETFIGKETQINFIINGIQKQHFLNFSYQANKDENGEIDGILLFAYDVTEHVNALKEIEANERAIHEVASHLKLATDSANLGTWSLDIKSQKLEWNALHKIMWGYDEHREDIVYEDWHKVIDAGDKEKVFKIVEEAKVNHSLYEIDYCINRANDGALRCIRSIGKYYYNDKGEAETLTGISIDITEKNQIEETLRYRKALLEAHNEANRDGLLLVDAKGKIISYNKSFIDIWHMPKEIVDAKDDDLALAFAMTQLVNPQQFVDKVKWMYEHPSERCIDELEYLDGRIIERHGYPVWGDDGTYYAWSWTFRDITEQKAVAEAIKESEAKFRMLSENIPHMVWTATPDGQKNFFNKYFMDYTGFSFEELKGDGWHKIIFPDDLEKELEQWHHHLKTGEDFNIEKRVRHHNGTYRWHISHGIAQKDEHGKTIGWIGTNTDITEQKSFSEALEENVKERTQELYEKNLQLEQTNAELISFSYISSHDLQEPLRKIQMFSSRILETESDTLSQNAMNYFERMQNSAYRMQKLIQDLIAYSRTNVQETKFVNTDLNVIIEDVKETLSEELEHKDINFKLNNICDIKIIPIQFTQVILNLVSNSIKFAKADLPLVIEIECEKVNGRKTGIKELSSQQNYIHIRVSDNGIGFEPQYNEKIFEVFQRLHGRDEYTGTGIGLAIVKRIIENHDGIILANGKLNEGATFDIYIPAH